MKKKLFRPEVSETNSDSWLGEIRLAAPISHRIWAIGALTCTAVIVAWLVFGEYTRRERVDGVLVPVGGYAKLKSRSPGEVRKILVREGQYVRKGQILIEIDNDRYADAEAGVADDVSATIQQEKATLRDDVANARRSAERRKQDLLGQIALVKQQMTYNQEMLGVFREEARAQSVLLKKMEPALEQGYVSATQVQQQRSSVASAAASVARQLTEKNSLDQQLRDLEGRIAQAAQDANVEINESIRQLARTDAAYDKNEAERKTVVKSPVDGYVGSLLIYPGQNVGNGTSLATIMPDDVPLEAEMLVGSSAVGFVRQGVSVAIHYRAFPFQKFGVHHGKVEYVSKTALAPSEIIELTGRTDIVEPMYRVRASLQQQTIRVYGEDKKLSAGMAISGGIMLDRRKIYEWIFEPLYTMRKKMENEQ